MTTVGKSGQGMAVAREIENAVIQEKAMVGSLLWGDEHQSRRVKTSKEMLRNWSLLVVPSHKVILSAVERVLERSASCDLVMLHAELSAVGKLVEVGGAQELAGLVEGVPNAASWEDYAKGLVRLSSRRKAIRLTQEISEAVSRGQDLNGQLEELALSAMEACSIATPEKKLPTWAESTHAPILSGEQILKASETSIDYVISPIVPRGYLTQIHGPPKGGKSTFMLYLGVAGATGQWPEGCPLSSTPLKVLYISWEDMISILSKRIISYAKGLGLDGVPPNLHVVEMPDLLLNLPANADALRQVITEHHYDLVVLDTLSHAHAVDEDRAGEIKVVMQTLARIAKDTNSAIAYVHHRRKNGEGVSMSERGRGSTAIGAAPVSIIDWGDRGETDITPVKVTGKLDYRATWEVEYIRVGEDAVRWVIREQESSKRVRKNNIGERVLEGLRALSVASPAGVPGRDVVGALSDQGIGKSAVYKHLGELESTGTVGRRTSGKTTFYTLTNL